MSRLVTIDSRNIKLRANKSRPPVIATMAPASTCPKSCPLAPWNKGPCYANKGNTGLHWRRVTNGARLPFDSARQEATEIMTQAPTDGRPMRLHVAGDCADPYSAAILGDAVSIWRQRGGGPAWTYTHGWLDRVPRVAWGADVAVLASMDTWQDDAATRALGYLAQAIHVPKPEARAYECASETPIGTRGIWCPQQSGRTTDCQSCGLCWRENWLSETKTTIVFSDH